MTSNPLSSSLPSQPSGALNPFQKIVIAHAVFCTVGFLLVLPAGALLARFMRTFSHSWFKGHWILQFGVGMYYYSSLSFVPLIFFSVAGIIILTGIILGFAAVANLGAPHVNSTHKVCLTALSVSRLIVTESSIEMGHRSFRALPDAMFARRRHPLGEA